MVTLQDIFDLLKDIELRIEKIESCLSADEWEEGEDENGMD